MDQDPGVHSERSFTCGARSSGEGVADHERGVGTRGDHHHRGHSDEAECVGIDRHVHLRARAYPLDLPPPRAGSQKEPEGVMATGTVVEQDGGMAREDGRRFRRLLSAAAIVCAVLTAVGLVLLWPGEVPAGTLRGVASLGPTSDAEVERVGEGACPGVADPAAPGCQLVTVRLTSGDAAGQQTVLSFPADAPDTGLGPGDAIIVARAGTGGSAPYSYVDRDRGPVLLILAVAFALAVVALGRLRGVMALVGLAASIFVILRFVLPAVLVGESPVVVAIVGSSVIAFLALYLAHGLGPLTNAALLGTISSLVITLVLSEVFSGLAGFTGFSGEEAFLVDLGAGQVDLRGLILAGIIIGALGAIDDITVTQASTVWELRAANPGSPTRDLFRSAMRVGRDHVASTVNTLFLAYAGASLPLLLLFVLAGRSLGSVANGEVIAVEIVRTLVGSIGLVASVPITTALAVLSFANAPTSARSAPLEGAPHGDADERPPDKLWLPERRTDLWRRGRRR